MPTRPVRHPKFFVGTYVFRVMHRATGDAQVLGHFDGEHDLLQVFEDFCTALYEAPSSAEGGTLTWQVERFERVDSRVCGTVEVGDSGYRSRIMDTETGETAYLRRTRDVDLVPMFFLLDAPAAATRGIIMLQKHGIRSPYSLFNVAFWRFFSLRFPEHALEIQPFVAQATLDAVLQGGLKRLTLARFQPAGELSDQARLGLPKAVPFHFEQVYRYPRGVTVPLTDWMRKALRKGAGADEVRAALPPGTESARITVHTTKGTSRTIELGSAEDMVPYIDATADLVADEGHPVYDSIRGYALNLLFENAKEIRGPK